MEKSNYGGKYLEKFVDKVLDSFDISICKCTITDPLAMTVVYSRMDNDIKNMVLEYEL